LNLTDQALRSRIIEDGDETNRVESRKDFHAILLSHHGTPLALESSHRGIAVHPDHKKIPQGACALEQIHVAGVEEVEAAVGENDRPTE